MKIGYVRGLKYGMVDFSTCFKILKNESLDKIYTDENGRDEYRKLLMELTESDTLYIWSVEELGQERDEIREQWEIISKEIGAEIRVINCPVLQSGKDVSLTERMVSDVALNVLSYQVEMINKKLKDLR